MPPTASGAPTPTRYRRLTRGHVSYLAARAERPRPCGCCWSPGLVMHAAHVHDTNVIYANRAMTVRALENPLLTLITLTRIGPRRWTARDAAWPLMAAAHAACFASPIPPQQRRHPKSSARTQPPCSLVHRRSHVRSQRLR